MGDSSVSPSTPQQQQTTQHPALTETPIPQTLKQKWLHQNFQSFFGCFARAPSSSSSFCAFSSSAWRDADLKLLLRRRLILLKKKSIDEAYFEGNL
ncbi:hypothetical protein M5K25_020291 [Dendrobium thyrsiflorum]|uniref:Uncharacterized protein n=1 Tax=Dendrobium thyrsiflorum TaxID=117978 RepID=A0ABD0UA99_DENTH